MLIALSALCLSCTIDYGTPATRNFAIDGSVSALDVSSAFQVTMSDKVNDVEVTVGENAFDKVVVKVKNGTLRIGFKLGTMYSGTPTAVIPSDIQLEDLELSGASSFTGNLEGKDVDIELSGASIFKGKVEATDLDVELSGASVANINGFCQETMHIELSGASDLRAANLQSQAVKGLMSGGSYADLTYCTSLKVSLSGGSHLTYDLASDDCDPSISCFTSGGSTADRWSPKK